MAAKNKLKDIRHEMRINFQAEMARFLGLGQRQYNYYERQKIQPSLEVALRIAKKLDMKVEDIFYLE